MKRNEDVYTIDNDLYRKKRVIVTLKKKLIWTIITDYSILIKNLKDLYTILNLNLL